LTTIGLVCKEKEMVAKFVFALFLVLLFIRFLLGVIFLAGENQRGKTIVNDWVTMSTAQKDQLSQDTKNYYSTFEGAYVFEIIDIVMMNILNPVMLLLWRHNQTQNFQIK
jgi:DNA-binding protein Fis